MSQNDTLTWQGNSKIRLLSKKFRSYGIEMTFKMREQKNRELHLELRDDCGSIVDVYIECFSEFLTVIRPVSEQRRLRILIFEDDEVIYQITVRIPAHYKPAEEYSENQTVSSMPAESVSETQAAATDKAVKPSSAEAVTGHVNGDLEVDFSHISEQALKMIDFKR